MSDKREILSILIIAAEGLKQHLFRSFLTALGIFFGVAAVIAMLSIGEGAREEVIGQIKSLGLDNIIIENSSEPESSESAKKQKSAGLTVADRDKLRALFPDLKITAETSLFVKAVINQKYRDLEVTSVDEKYFPNHNFKLKSGRFFTSAENQAFSKVCLISANSARKNFPGQNPLGAFIKINAEWYQVIGTFDAAFFKDAKLDEVSLKDYNNSALIPLKTYLKRMSSGSAYETVDRIVVTVPDQSQSAGYAKVISNLLARLHFQTKDYKLILPGELLARHRRTQNIFNIVMGTIASISLIVGGIGIANIMLANTLERRKEIGVRRACGATAKSIMLQFLSEAVLISLSGGITGVLFGILLTYLISYYAGWQTSITLLSVVLSFFVSITVGVLAGFLPAKKAAKMEPIEALRYE